MGEVDLNAVQRRMKLNGIIREQLAQQLYVSYDTICNRLRDVFPFTVQELYIMSKLFHCSMENLLVKEDNRP